jgi:D-alanyl-D-alanine carboxypeptidase
MRVIQTHPSYSKPKKARRNLSIFFVLLVLILLATTIFVRQHNSPSLSKAAPGVIFNKAKYSINDPNSIWVVVNKGRILPSDYMPADLVAPNVPLRLSSTDPEMQMRQVTATALQQMFTAAAQQNVHLMVSSAYRSYSAQVGLYRGYVLTQGQQNADSSSARAGHSEHQTGLAADIEPQNRKCEVEQCFADTPEGQWLAANAYKYGFIIRYEKGKENLTGYEYEPWHVRYVGTGLAAQIHQTGQTLEQFFNLPANSAYSTNSYHLTPNS